MYWFFCWIGVEFVKIIWSYPHFIRSYPHNVDNLWYQNDIKMISQNELHTIRNNTYIYVLSQLINDIDLFYPDISGWYIHVMQSRFCTFGQNVKYIRIPCISMDGGWFTSKKLIYFVIIPRWVLLPHHTKKSLLRLHLDPTSFSTPPSYPPKYTYFYSKPTSYQPYITHTKPLTKSIHYLTSYANSKT